MARSTRAFGSSPSVAPRGCARVAGWRPLLWDGPLDRMVPEGGLRLSDDLQKIANEEEIGGEEIFDPSPYIVDPRLTDQEDGGLFGIRF